MTLYDDIEGVIAAVNADIDRLNAAKLKLTQALDALDPELDDDTDTDDDDDTEPTAEVVAVAPAPKRTKNAKHDWDAIGEIARIAQAAGQPIGRTLAEELGVNMTTANWMVKRCRELGHIAGSQRFTKEPMTREPFDPQKARDAAAGPKVGKVEWASGQRQQWPTIVQAALARYDVADAIAAIEGAA